MNQIDINIKTEYGKEYKEINIESPLLAQLKIMYDNQYIMASFGEIDITEENTAKDLGIDNDSTISLIMKPREPTVFDVLSTSNEYNIPQKYIELFNETGETQINRTRDPYIKEEMIEMGYYQEIKKFIEQNKAQIGDILFVGSSNSRPINCFTIVVENNKYNRRISE